MKPDYWVRQDKDAPLFPNLLWSRPENRQYAGKLLVVGGHAQGFAVPAEAVSEAGKAGIGTTRVMLPDSLTRIVSKVFPEAEFVPSTPSGSLARTALAELLSAAAWADAVLLAGDFGKNSETAILLESFVQKYTGPLAIAGDGVDYFLNLPAVLDREYTLLVPNFTQLQKLFMAGRSTQPLTSKLDFLHMLDALHAFTAQHQAAIVFEHERQVFVCVQGRVSTTKFSIYDLPSPVQIAAGATVWWLQNPGKPFEALTSSLVADKVN